MNRTPHPSRALAVLTLCSFTLGTGEIMIAGLLPGIADDVSVPLSTAGLLVSAFALTVVGGGPVLALGTGRAPRRGLLVALMGCYVLGNVVSALAPGFGLLAGGRVLAALAHSALMPLFFRTAADLVPPQRRGRAVARVSTGFSLAMVAGLPLGTAVGQWLGWRATFWAVAALTVVVTVCVARLVPGTAERDSEEPAAASEPAAPEPASSIRLLTELRVLGDRPVRAVTAITALSAAAAFTAYTYVTPLLTDTVGFSPSATTVLLLLFGIGGTVGSTVGGRLTDRSVTGAIGWTVGALAATLLLLAVTAGAKAPAVAALFLFGAAYYAVIPAVNTRLLDVAAGRARTLALTVQSSAFNLGTALGGWLGGRLLTAGAGLDRLPLAGSLIALAALAWALREAAGERRGAVADRPGEHVA